MEVLAPVTTVTPVKKVKAKRRAGRKWTAEDDKKVAELVGIHGTHKWSFIGSLCGRNGKQCREDELVVKFGRKYRHSTTCNVSFTSL